MLDRAHDLDLPPYSDQIRLGLDLALLDRLDRHLKRERFKPMLLGYVLDHMNPFISVYAEEF